jgi:hypothetical protein
MRPVGLLLALVAALVLAGCGGSNDEVSPPAQTETTETQPAEPMREAAPAIEGATLDGAAIELADFSGRPVLVNVWSSW